LAATEAGRPFRPWIVLVFVLGWQPLAAAWAVPPWVSSSRRHSRATAAAKGSETRRVPIRLNYLSAGWDKVLRDVADSFGLTLVMEKVPPGRFSRRDRRSYTKEQAIRILNHELEPKGFRLFEQGSYLLVLPVDALRARYTRPVLRHKAESQTAATRSRASQPTDGSVIPAASEERSGVEGASRLQLAEHEQSARPQEAAKSRSGPSKLGNSETVAAPKPELPGKTTLTVQVRTQSAVNLSRSIYEAYASRAELVDDGPKGLPGFVVFVSSDQNGSESDEQATASSDQSRRPVQFAVGIDTANNRLIIEAPSPMAQGLAQLVRMMDREPRDRDDAVQFVASDKDVRQIARDLTPAVRKLVTGPTTGETVTLQKTSEPPAGQAPEADQTNPPPKKPPAQQPSTEPSGRADSQQAVIGGLKGEVTIEYVPGVGFVLRGNEEDVAKVEAILKMIEEISVGATPGIHLRMLRHVNSQALGELLATVYEQVSTVKGAAQTLPPPAFVPVVKPNAVLVIAAGDDLPSILELIDQLDRPVDPRTQFAVFRLKNAIASQVVTMLESFYEDRAGLGARVRAVADMRTNAVVVQAEPNDLKEVALLIQKIDQEASEAVNDIKIFPLKNALAEELANLINQSIQSVLSPAMTGTAGQVQVAASARVAQELQEAKSAILQFLAVDGNKQGGCVQESSRTFALRPTRARTA